MSDSNGLDESSEMSTRRKQLQNDAGSILRGFGDNDVEWFLRGTIKKTAPVDGYAPMRLAGSKPESSSHTKMALKTPAKKIPAKNSDPASKLSEAKAAASVNAHKVTAVGTMKSTNSNNDTAIRRTRSHSVADTRANNNGFFSKFSSRFRKKSPLTSETSTMAPKDEKFDSASSESDSEDNNAVVHRTVAHETVPAESLGYSLSRSKSTPTINHNFNAELDPRFQKFLDVYRNKQHHEEDSKPSTPATTPPISVVKTKPRVNSLSRILSRSDDSVSSVTHESSNSPKVDALGRSLPPLPEVAPLPSALKLNHKASVHNDVASDASSVTASSPKSSGILGSFLRRHQDSSASKPGSISDGSSQTSADSSTDEIPGFVAMTPLKRVTFSEKVFFNDPPQQIASRNPKKGEVEILKNGHILIHKLTPEERQQKIQQGGGVVVGGYRHAIHMKEEAEKASVEKSAPSEKSAETQGKAEGSSEDSAEKDEATSEKAKSISIDKPMATRNKSLSSLKNLLESSEGSEESLEQLMSKKVPLDILYTRCCHLREILPIKSTFKQIPKGFTGTLEQLQFKNSMPSLIEIVTFSDFISIAPVKSIILDGLSLSLEMFKILIASMAYKTDLMRLSLRNTQIDSQGWKLLCWFLVKNKKLESIDITQCEFLDVLPSKSTKPKSAAITAIKRMESNKNDRSDMDWPMFVASLIYRGGIESLVLTGCKINNIEAFTNLFKLGLRKTKKIGLAYNDVSPEQVKIICDWLFENCETLQALDFGYNNLSMISDGKRSFHYLIEVMAKITEGKRHSALQYLSMNSTEIYEEGAVPLSDVDLVEASSFVFSLSKFNNLQFLDISGNARYFKTNIEMFCSILPQFKALSRLHLEHNQLTDMAAVVLSDALVSCKKIYYLSLVGNEFGSDGYLALIGLLKKTSIISLNLDYDKVPPKFKTRIGVVTMQNMEEVIKNNKGFTLGDQYGNEDESSGDEEEEEVNTVDIQDEDQYSLGSLSEEIIIFMQNYMKIKENGEKVDDVEVKDKVDKFLLKLYQVKKGLGDIINRLVALRLDHKLNKEGKEALIRFCFIDNSLDKMLRIFRDWFEEYYISFFKTHPLDDEIAERKSIVLKDKGHMTGEVQYDESEDAEQYSEIPNNIYSLGDINLPHVGSSTSLLSLKELDKEEGSVLKATSKISHELDGNTKLIDFDHSTASLDGRKIKEVLLDTSKLGKIINVIDSMKENNISIDDVFKETQENDDDEGVVMKGDSKKVADDNESVTSASSDDSANSLEDLTTNKTYDTLVDDLVRVRSRQI